MIFGVVFNHKTKLIPAEKVDPFGKFPFVKTPMMLNNIMVSRLQISSIFLIKFQ